MVVVVVLLIVAAVLGVVMLPASLRIVKQYERGVVYRFGRVDPLPKGPGPRLLLPFVDRMTKVNMQVVTMPVPSQEGITRDNVSVRVDAVLYFRVVDPIRATVDVQNYEFAMLQVAQTSLRSIIGKSDLDDLLSGREKLHEGLELMLSTPATGWGVHIDRVEIKDVALPESMKRSMARQAEADRERRARIITADGELQASHKLSEAARAMDANPAALQLRMLQTVVEVAAEKNSTLVLPFPVELLRFFDRAAQGSGGAGDPQRPTGAPDTEATDAPGTGRPVRDGSGGPAGLADGSSSSGPAAELGQEPDQELDRQPDRAELPKSASPQIPDPRSSEE
ncbi:slipin family protein [Actinacidiphila acididurans]|uniref:Slipin family protein n=1 Tax=Actinacidiphila acididurans TaxID=2784346 RepID=A0ABS2TQH6_9ACTN|nr:slipin family protein [Actinacidiphila acididurans]MBM9505589.1 slipin family protein [Actinacidiphila acididurans]